MDKYREEGVDISSKEAESLARLICDLHAVDVAEVYSPARLTAQCRRLGLRGGFAVDLNAVKKNGEHWDLNREGDEQELMDVLEEEDPEFLIGSPTCTPFSPLRRLSDFKRSPTIVKTEQEEGKHHIRGSVRAYARQLLHGKCFLHEAPRDAESWNEPDMVWLAAQPGVHWVKGPMCRWKMTQADAQGEGYIRKETGWLTNDESLAHLLGGVCTNMQGKTWHRHIHLRGGRARLAQVYPPPSGGGHFEDN